MDITQEPQRIISTQIRKRQKVAHRNKNGTILKNCKECGKPYDARVDNIRKGKGVFCSRKCSAIATQHKNKTFKKCEACGNKFNAYKRKMRFCSVKCCRARIKPGNYNPDRNAVRVNQRLAIFCCSLIGRCFKIKTNRTLMELGYSPQQLKAHIESLWESWMNWNNYGHSGPGVWNIDHIKPISTFPSNATVAEINALSNLRPLLASKNYAKKNRTDVV